MLQRGEQLGLRFQGGSGIVLEGDEPLGVPPCLKVVHVMPGSPCAKAGLIAGDLIYQIGGEAVEGLSHDDCVLLIRRYPERLVMQIKRAE
jgi:C-terminal processing protease CtpA/Prc